jgi:hypothetical protein
MDTLLEHERPSAGVRPGKEPSRAKRDRQARKELSYYNPIFDNDTREIVGHLADISTGGFRMDSSNPIPIDKDFRFRMNLSSEVADKPDMVFIARSKWCKADPIDPYIYNIGYQLIHISPGDIEIFNRMMEKYGREPGNRPFDLRRSNKW